jgi:hypothetical protein
MLLGLVLSAAAAILVLILGAAKPPVGSEMRPISGVVEDVDVHYFRRSIEIRLRTHEGLIHLVQTEFTGLRREFRALGPNDRVIVLVKGDGSTVDLWEVRRDGRLLLPYPNMVAAYLWQQRFIRMTGYLIALPGLAALIAGSVAAFRRGD